MKIASLTVFFLVWGLTASAQHIKRDSILIRQIDTMFKYDQLWRKEYAKVAQGKPSKYSDETINRKMTEADSINLIKAKGIIKKYGYPGFDRVGETSNNFWAIVQHCDDDIPFQEQVLTLMKVQIAHNNADKANYAYLTDRVLTNKHQKQIYGTQIHVDPKTHKATPMPLKYPKLVNKLRTQMGLGTEEEYLKSFR